MVDCLCFLCWGSLMRCNVSWSAPRWAEIASRAHRCSGRDAQRRWDMSFLTQDTTGGKSLYDPYMQRNQIRDMELSCVTIQQNTDSEGELPVDVCHVRRFYRRYQDQIGASEGVKTNCILVQYASNGDVHGYPVTESYLRLQGAQI